MKRGNVMKKLFALMLVVVLTFSLVACGGEKEATIVGSWESVDMAGAIYNFGEGGKGSYEYMGASMDFTYTDDGTAVTITYTNSEPSTFKYTIDGNKLNIEDSFGSTVVYKKK